MVFNELHILVGLWVFNIVLTGLSFCFFKKWGKSLVVTFLFGTAFLVISPSTLIIFPNYIVSNILLIIYSIFIISFFMYVCLKRQNNIVILKDKKLIILLISMLVISIFVGVFSQKLKSIFPVKINSFLYVFSLLVFYPFLEELLCREIVFKLIPFKKNLFINTLILFLLALLFAISHLLSLNRTILQIVFLTGLFMILSIVRYFLPQNKWFFLTILIHCLWNCWSLSFQI